MTQSIIQKQTRLYKLIDLVESNYANISIYQKAIFFK